MSSAMNDEGIENLGVITWYHLIKNTAILMIFSFVLTTFGPAIFSAVWFAITYIYDAARRKCIEIMREAEGSNEIDLGVYETYMDDSQSDDTSDDSDDDVYYDAFNNEEDLQAAKEPKPIKPPRSHSAHWRMVRVLNAYTTREESVIHSVEPEDDDTKEEDANVAAVVKPRYRKLDLGKVSRQCVLTYEDDEEEAA